MTIIALSGKARTGKDTFANVLVKRYNFQRVALADPLRELCSKVFSMDIQDFLDDNKKDARMDRVHIDFHHLDKIRDIVETEWGYTVSEDSRNKMEESHGVELDTPRDLLRHVGTKILRNHVDDDIWVRLAATKIKALGGKIVVTDCRFENERDFFAGIGAIKCLIKRNDNGNSKEHEFDLGSEDDYDVIFSNDGTLQQYISNVDMWYSTSQHMFTLYRVWKYE